MPLEPAERVDPAAVEDAIDALLRVPPYEAGHEGEVLELLRAQVLRAAGRNASYGNYVAAWPVEPERAERVADLPYLPVDAFKRYPPLVLVGPGELKRVVRSSATTGQVPSQIAIDGPTSRRMTKGTAIILRDFLGAERRPYLVVDVAGSNAAAADLSARGAAIRGLMPFASEVRYGMQGDADGRRLDLDAVLGFADEHRGETVLLYGFTFILWKEFVEPLLARGRGLGLERSHVLHSGGWKRLTAEAVDRERFDAGVAEVVGCPPENVIDFYGMVENVGIVYPDCPEGSKHAPVTGGVIVRDPLTLEPVPVGGTGILQVCSVLPTSFPGHLLLTADMGTVTAHGDCPCGRAGTAFRFAGRVPKAELRGCGDVAARRQGLEV